MRILKENTARSNIMVDTKLVNSSTNYGDPANLKVKSINNKRLFNTNQPI